MIEGKDLFIIVNLYRLICYNDLTVLALCKECLLYLVYFASDRDYILSNEYHHN